MSDRTNLIETISKIDMFSTFSRMLRTAKAEDLLQGEGGFTVFVPTNDAFGKIPDSQMNGWLSETDQVSLKALLSYHIIPGKLFAANLSGAGTVKTLSGQEITFTDTNGLRVNRAGLQSRNIEATNGVVHGLDTVLTPPANAAETAVGVAVAAAAAAATAPVPTTPAAVPTATTPAATTETTPVTKLA